MFEELFSDLFADPREKNLVMAKGEEEEMICQCSHGKLVYVREKGIYETDGMCELDFSCAVMKRELRKIDNMFRNPLFNNKSHNKVAVNTKQERQSSKDDPLKIDKSHDYIH